MQKKILTLTVICDNNKVLLGMKKRGYAAGRWNGFGGKLNEGESIEDGMVRELFEESGLKSISHTKRGILTFESDTEDYISEVHIYKINDYEGDLVETEEMSPRWFDIDQIPYSEMWPDDEYWLPLLIEGKTVRGKFNFADDSSIKNYELIEVADLG